MRLIGSILPKVIKDKLRVSVREEDIDFRQFEDYYSEELKYYA